MKRAQSIAFCSGMLIVVTFVCPSLAQQPSGSDSARRPEAAVASQSAGPGQSANHQTPADPAKLLIPELMSREREMEMALSAGPEHIRKEATVYVLEKNGFVKVREGSNGFACIVNRDHPLNLKPTCYDAEGVATILPKVLRVGELLMQGKPMAEINAEIREGFHTGKYISPRRSGVAYMLSGDIRNYNPSTGKTDSFPPHLMFYAPNLTNADIGTTAEAMNKNPWLPFVAYQGPHGYIIVVVGDQAKHPSDHR